MSASTFRKSCGAADLKQEPNACGHAIPNLQDLSVCHNMLSGIRWVMQRWRLGKLGDLRRMTISNHCNRLEAEDRHAAGSMVYIVAMKQNAHAMTITILRRTSYGTTHNAKPSLSQNSDSCFNLQAYKYGWRPLMACNTHGLKQKQMFAALRKM